MRVTFMDPPMTPGRGRLGKYPWQEIADQLKERPGEWALVLTGLDASPITSINTGKYVAFQPPRSFEAVSRSRAPKGQETPQPSTGKVYDIYVRYLGEAETNDDDDRTT